jgi:hypothetical protein
MRAKGIFPRRQRRRTVSGVTRRNSAASLTVSTTWKAFHGISFLSETDTMSISKVPGKSPCLAEAAREESAQVKPNRKLQWVMEQAADKAGIVWTPNVLRHSFCSYAVAAKGFTWTSLQADHSERMLREHYREVVSAEDAERYLKIRPV